MSATEVENMELPLGAGLRVDKMPAHWLMARLGKRVLRPGGREATGWLLDTAAIGPSDDVVEFAPGLGITARQMLAFAPRTYVGVERDEAAVQYATRSIAAARHGDARIVQGDASKVPLADDAASLVLGEAMLSMQPDARKKAIVHEAARLLRPGGRYAIHELAVAADTSRERLDQIQADLSKSIHVGVRIGTPADWRAVLEEAGLVVESETIVPMRLLELDRLVADEGLLGTARFTFNALRTPGALRRLSAVRGTFRAHADKLTAIAMVARRPIA